MSGKALRQALPLSRARFTLLSRDPEKAEQTMATVADF
jgi:hypothetical protein